MKMLFIHTGAENLGLEALSAWLKRHGHETEILFDPGTFAGQENAMIGPLARLLDISERLVNRAVESDADLIGFSAYTVNYLWALDIAGRIKERVEKPIVFGGIHATAVPERVLGNPQVDAVVRGEGEGALLDLLEGMRNGRLPDRPIPNVWRRKEGDLVSEPVRGYIHDLDSLPLPDKDLFYKKVPLFSRAYMIMTSRGCPHRCSYCCNSLYHKLYESERSHVRRRTPDNVIDELRWARERYRLSYVTFFDDVFTTDPEWLRRFAEIYPEIGLPYDCYTHPLAIDEERGRLLAETGCFRAKIGLQTVSDKTRRKHLNRPGTAEEVAGAVRILKDHGVEAGIDHMIGLPDEGTAELDEAAEYYSRLRPERINSYWMIYFPGTIMLDASRRDGRLTEGQKETVEEGRGDTSFMYFSDKVVSERKELTPYQTFFDLLPMLPRRVAAWMVKRGWPGRLPYHPIIRQIIVTAAALFQGDRRYRNTLRLMFSRKRVP